MLIGIMSDSHDNVPQIKKAVEYFNSINADIVLHAGDIISPFCANELSRLKCRFLAVFGNNDGEKRMWRARVKGWGEVFDGSHEEVFEGVKILIVHEPDRLDEFLQDGQYGVIIFGHTHKIEERMIGNTLVVNPGESGGWVTGKCTVATLKLPEREFGIIDL